jgi:hypothetical protein
MYSDDSTVQAIFQNIHDGKPPLQGITVTETTGVIHSTDPSKVHVKC